MSAKTGFYPQFKTAFAVETHVKLGIIISPFTPNDLTAHSKALVHEFIAIEYLILNFLLNNTSNFVLYGPCVSQLDFKDFCTSLISFLFIDGLHRGIFIFVN